MPLGPREVRGKVLIDCLAAAVAAVCLPSGSARGSAAACGREEVQREDIARS